MKKIEFFIMRKIPVKFLMDLIVNAKRRKLPKIDLPKGSSALIRNGNQDKHVRELINEGYTSLPDKIDPRTIEQIVEYSKTINCFDNYNDPNTPVNPSDAPSKCHVAYYRRSDLVQCKPIMDIANDPAILNIVQEFLGAKPTISNVNMWWSFGDRKQAEHAQLFHRDLDDWRFCKLFVYLTDVSENSGPHVYVRNSSNSPKLRRIRRYKDAEIEKVFGRDNVLKFTGLKGTAFLVDTYGYHKGLLPVSDNRLLLQVQYSLHPIAVETYTPVKTEQGVYQPYVNRLLIKNGDL
jgi:hypothetical protein